MSLSLTERLRSVPRGLGALEILFFVPGVLHGSQDGLMEMVRHVLVIAVDHETSASCRRMTASLQLEMTIIVGTSSDASMHKLHSRLGANREEYDLVSSHTQPERVRFRNRNL